MVVLKTIRHLSKDVEEYFNITRQVHDIVRQSGVKNGLVAVITAHTTTGILVNEALPCVEADISEMLEKTVPLEAPYLHAHFLPTSGATSNNSQGHLKSVLTGNHCLLSLIHIFRALGPDIRHMHFIDGTPYGHLVWGCLLYTFRCV